MEEKKRSEDFDESRPLASEEDGESVSEGRLRFMQIATVVLAVAIAVVVVMIFRMRPAGSSNGERAKSTASQASGEVKVPDLLGLTVDEALKETESLHIGLKFRDRITSNKEEDTIVETDPAAGTAVKENSTIEYILSSGPESIRLPDYSSDLYTDAVDDIRNRGFADVSIRRRTSSHTAPGYVIRTKPASGIKVRTDEKVIVYVSIGASKDALISMPSLRGMTRAEALRTCARQGLFMKVTDGISTYQKVGTVTGQSIEPGMVVKVGSQLTMTIVKKKGKLPEEEKLQRAEVRLGPSVTYGGGPYRLVLEETKDSVAWDILCEKGETLTFPHTVTVTGQSGVPEGTLHLYEKVDDTYISRATWPVTFSAEKE